MFTGHCENPYRSNQPPRHALIEYLRRHDHLHSYLVHFGVGEG